MTIFDDDDRARLLERLGRLTTESSARWGLMTVGEMLCHCADGIDMATGERPVKNRSNFFFRNIVKPLVVHVLPMPKGAPTAPELKAGKGGTTPGDLDADRARLIEKVNHFASLPESFGFADHGAFGPLKHKEWGLLLHKHLDHHLKQFGV